GPHVFPETVQAIRNGGAVAIQFYPDTGFKSHSRHLARAAVKYDWFFSTKPAHTQYFKDEFAYSKVSFLPHAFDPEVHRPTQLSDRDSEDYSCDIGFAGNPSAKKHKTVAAVVEALPDAKIKIWGGKRWGSSSGTAAPKFQGSTVLGVEYAKAIAASKINLGLLYEGDPDGAPDVITARTFEIPAAGGFMLHERTDEAMDYFEDGTECVFFNDVNDLVDKIRYYLTNETERLKIAAAGRERCLRSGYSVDDRVRSVLKKYYEIKYD
ncbi:MAG: glycosyltransferase, partial [Pseudomonadota bacterium]